MTIRRLQRRAPGYPPLLRAIPDPPPVLWLRGEEPPELLGRPSVAVVGARACSSYGRSVARTLGRELAAAGLVVVSGMARGIDGEAHRGALDAGGVTVAVLGCGIDRDYPAAHRDLAGRITERGLIVSEYEAGVEPAPWRFPARNRIIAGLCVATIVVEARERSGALITADFALEDGREVMAVPGEITSVAPSWGRQSWPVTVTLIGQSRSRGASIQSRISPNSERCSNCARSGLRSRLSFSANGPTATVASPERGPGGHGTRNRRFGVPSSGIVFGASTVKRCRRPARRPGRQSAPGSSRGRVP